MHEIEIITCGGTISKVYNPLSGDMIVPQNNNILTSILNQFFKKNDYLYKIKECLYKDSLDMDDNDRLQLKMMIEQYHNKRIIIIHGTDTMHLSAKFLVQSAINNNLSIVFVGAMEPLSISLAEGAINLGCAYGFLQSSPLNGVYISMNGIIQTPDKIIKNHSLGYFQCQK